MTTIRNGFTKRDMVSKYDIEQEVLEYIKRLESTLSTRQEEVKVMQKQIKELEEELKVNPKASGRKDKFTAEQKKEIRGLRTKGVSIKNLAEHYKCSTTLIHKICKDIEVDLRKQERGVKITTLIKTQNA